MGYKNSDPCIQKAFSDERLFVLMARDETAPLVIEEWCRLNKGRQPTEKLLEAYECAAEMRRRCAEFNERKKNELVLTVIPDPSYIDCDQCDGCGWYEGGPTLNTECKKCNGTGKIKKHE